MPITIPLIAADGATSTVTVPDPVVVGAGIGVPALVQFVSSTTINLALSTDVGNNFKISMPNKVGAGNCLVLAITYPSGRIPTVTDNNGNAWPATPAAIADAGSGGTASSIFVLPNAKAGVTTINIAFNASVSPMQYTVGEWFNVATANPVSGGHGAASVSGAALATGAFTPGNNNANGGNLIFAYFAPSNLFSSGNPSDWIPGGSFTLLDGDITWTNDQGFPKASMFFVQPTSASINPSIAATGDTADTFNCVAVALKAASAGTPIPAGIHVNKIIHFSMTNIPATWFVKTPATGNLRVVSSTTVGNLARITDNEGGGNWAIATAGDSCFLYSANKSPNANLRLSVTGFGAQNSSIRFWDIQGADPNPFDNFVNAGGRDFSGQTIVNDMPIITPSTANGLVIANMSVGQGPGLGLAPGSPAGAVWDFALYDGEHDTSQYDNADCEAHLYNTDLSTLHWNWHITSNSGNSGDGAAVAFKAAPHIIPANRTTLWQPGVTYNGGIPNRTTIYKTLAPLGGTNDDTPQIQAAVNSCPAGQVVQLTAGVFNINGNGIDITTSNITLRGVGPGNALSWGTSQVSPPPGAAQAGGFVPDPTATQLLKADRLTNLNYEILNISPPVGGFGASINLTVDAPLNSNSVTLASNPGFKIGEIVYIDQNTDNHPDVFWGLAHDPPGGGSRRWFIRQDRSLSQMAEITAISGNTLTFATPLHCAFQTKYTAQVTRLVGLIRGVGIEELMLFGGRGGDGHGNLAINFCSYSWVKHVEAAWSVGTDIGFYTCYRCELRDSFIHETPDPNPGGGGYLVGLNFGSSDCLVENCIMWYGNKVNVMRGTGGGNVLAYCYTDDSFGSAYPHSPEAGINAGHYTTPHMELLEGNYSHNYKGDSYWGNSIDITVFRNHLSDLRAAHAPLAAYAFVTGGCTYRYGDWVSRVAVDVQANSLRTNFVGNVLGTQGQQLLGYNSNSCFDSQQVGFTFEQLSNFSSTNQVEMWEMGSQQNPDGWAWVSTTFQTQLRQGNWDWVTKSQIWYASPIGATGTPGGGTPQPIPNSLYLTSKPAFFGNNPWPWVDPSTGLTTALPAKARFDAGTPNNI